ncbi:hypothetical protein EYF80_040713 [Liparis tanakae]|uniref:Uncharacterized protein n=1 Tax=Liparis tanakae TaxID=230148 RepID=A0A4Z2G6A6_9TELE|nr:hypothetical protein EYF80_040713 [Liparis tanakae]
MTRPVGPVCGGSEARGRGIGLFPLWSDGAWTFFPTLDSLPTKLLLSSADGHRVHKPTLSKRERGCRGQGEGGTVKRKGEEEGAHRECTVRGQKSVNSQRR